MVKICFNLLFIRPRDLIKIAIVSKYCTFDSMTIQVKNFVFFDQKYFIILNGCSKSISKEVKIKSF